MSKNKSRIEKSTSIISGAKATQWCYVNTENEFEFMNKVFIISEDVEEYRVYNKSFDVEDYTNEAYMEDILVILDADNNLKFYNQNYDEIHINMIKAK